MTKPSRSREPIRVAIEGDRAVITGDAYMQKELIKPLDFKWSFERKVWHGPAENAEPAKLAMLENGAIVIMAAASPDKGDPTDQSRPWPPPASISVTIECNGMILKLPATASDIELLYRHAVATINGSRRAS